MKAAYGKKIGRTIAGMALSAAIAVGAFNVGYGMKEGVYEVKAAAAVTAGEEREYVRTSLTSEARQNLDSYSDVYKAVENAVVSISVSAQIQAQQQFSYFNMPWNQGGIVSQGEGSGVIFNEDADSIYIVTNYHVVEGATTCSISLDDETLVQAGYIGGDAITDIAVISVKKTDLAEAGVSGYSVAAFGDSDKMEIGDQVMAVGNANGDGKSATNGIVSAKDRQVSIDNTVYSAIQTNAAINQGNSGGALVNMRGEVIGINAAKLSSSSVEGVGYAIPSNTVAEIVSHVMESEGEQRPVLGISGYTLEYGEGTDYTSLGLPESGVIVAEITDNTTAQYIGLKEGDIIVSFNGTAIKNMERLKELIENTNTGDSVEIQVARVTYNRTPFGSSVSGAQNITLSGEMRTYSSGPSF